MSPRTRALVGAAIGAVTVLVASPRTRSGMLTTFLPASPNQLHELLERPPLSPPTDLDSGAAYLHEGADRLQKSQTLNGEERHTLLAIAKRGEDAEPENSFWPLAVAVFRRADDPATRGAWRRASRCHRYFDHQRSQLIADLQRVSRGGDIQAWMYAAIAPLRSAAMIRQISNRSVALMRPVRKDEDRMEFAYETVCNGAMIRDGSERLSLGREGIAMIERASYPPNLMILGGGSSTRRLWIAKTTLTHNLRQAGRAGDAILCDRQFRINDATLAFGDVVDPQARFDALATGAVFIDTLPSAFLVVSAAGGLVGLFGRRIAAVAKTADRFRGPGLTACSLALLTAGVGVGYPTIGLAAGACALVPAAGPERPRRFDGGSLGPLHVLTVACLALALGASAIFAAVALSLPGRILPNLGTTGPLFADAGRWEAVGIVVLGASAFVAPAWALVRRFSTPALAALTYENLGRSMAVSGLVLGIVASPVTLALNHWVGNSLAEIALNEQNAYAPAAR